MKIQISAESTIDLSKELLDEFSIKIIPYLVTLGDKSAADGVITPDDIYDYVDKTGVLPRTSAINVPQYTEYFTGLQKDADVVIHITLSSYISSTYQNAVLAAREMKNVYVIDSLSLSTGIALLAIYASNLAKEGKKPEEIVSMVEARREHDQTSFVLATVDYLHKGGRCSSLAKLGALLFRIRPQIIMKNGQMGPSKKYMGKQVDCVANYCKDTLQEFNNPDLSIGFVTHSGATPDMIEVARKALEERGFKRILETRAGATISSHCGPKCLGILYLNDGGR